MGLVRRLPKEANFTGVWVPVVVLVLTVSLPETMNSLVLKTGAKVCCFFIPHLCSLILGGFVLLSLLPKRKGTLSASSTCHLIFGTRTLSGSITYLSCLLYCYATFVAILLGFFLLACFPVCHLCKYAIIL